MSSLCPVCNGLQAQVILCPRCGQSCDDLGRYSDLFGPYSPYREIEDMKLTNGVNDIMNQQCIHISYCPICDLAQNVAVDEWPSR